MDESTVNNSDEIQGEQALFAKALAHSPEQRGVFLDEACHDNPALRARLEALLAAHEQPATELGDVAQEEMVPLEDMDSAVGQSLGPRDKLGVGRYKLLERLGEGGCGVVYVAEQTEPVRRRVALKVIKLGMDTKAVVARFEAERQALAMMDHPNIAKVLDAGTTGQGRPYFVMELVRGIKITDYCDQEKVSTKVRLELFIKICHAIQHAHQKGIIHRDIKPSNILVTLHDGVPVPKVIDFGIAKATEGRLTDATVYTQLHQFIGTPAYMSPEQAEMSGLDIDTRSDIYSLGVLLYELLTGKTPFDGGELISMGLDAMRQTIREKEPARPSTKLATLPGEELTTTAKRRSVETSKLVHLLRGDLDWIVMKCLEKDRARRYDTANGLAADITRHLSNEPVVARPPSAAYRFQKAWKRNKVAYTAGIAVAAALVVGIGVSLWQAAVANIARERESQANERLSAQFTVTDVAKREAETLAAAESRQRLRAEDLLNALQLQRAVELLEQEDTLLGVGNLIQLLRANPSNEVAAARLTWAMMQPIAQPVSGPLRHESWVSSTMFSPDGQRVVTASYDKTARVWDARSGQPVTDPMRHDKVVYSAAFSPDGLRVVTASRDQTARVWDARSGQPITDPLRHNDSVYRAAFSPDGDLVVTASLDGTARVWDARSGQPVTEPLRHDDRVNSAAFSPEGLRVVTASKDHTARVWDARSGQLITEFRLHQRDVVSAEFSPDGRRVVTASEDKTARVWDAGSGQPISETLRHDHIVFSATFSPDGQRVVTASYDKTARVWDAHSGEPLTEPLRHGGQVSGAQFSPDGQRVVTASYDKTARVWDTLTGQPLTEPLRHEGYVYINTPFSSNGLWVVTVSDDGARVWDTRVLPPLTLPVGHSSGEPDAQFSPDGQRVLTAYKTARVWDANTGQPVTSPLPHDGWINSAEFSSDGLQVVTASHDKTARLWDARTGQPLDEPLRHEGVVYSAAFSPDARRVVTASADKTARVWDARSGQPLTDPLRHEGEVYSAAFSPDGRHVVTASMSGTAWIWDAQTGKPVMDALRHDGGVISATFSQDGQRVVTASHDKTARVWDARNGQPVADPMWHDHVVFSVEFSPDGRRVVTASVDKTARVWDVRSGQPVTEPLRHEAAVLYATFSPDGLRVVTASDDKTARVWDARSGHPLTGPLRHYGYSVGSARFSPDGLRVVTGSYEESARVWEVFPPVIPVPAWFLDWAEARLGRRFSAGSATTGMALEERLQLQQAASARIDTNYYTRLAQWAQADPMSRAISPHSSMTVSDYLRQRIAENSLTSLHDALRWNPTNSVAWARLALLQINQSTNQATNTLVEVEFSARRALLLDPTNGEGWRALGKAQLQTGRVGDAAQSAERALQWLPGTPDTWELLGDVLSRQRQWADAFDAYRRASAVVVETNLAGFQLRATLLRKYLEVMAQTANTGSEWEERFQNDLTQCLALGRGMSGDDIEGLRSVWQGLADACSASGRRETMERVLADSRDWLRRRVAARPEDPAILPLAVWELWMGEEARFEAICKQLLSQPVETFGRDKARRVALLVCLRPRFEVAELETLLRVIAEEQYDWESSVTRARWTLVQWMIQYRLEHFAEDEQTSIKLVRRDDSIGYACALFRAMCLHHLDKQDEARELFAATEAQMKPLPADERNPFAGNATTDDLVLWLAYKEAKDLLRR